MNLLALVPVLGKLIEKVIPDKDAARLAKDELVTLMATQDFQKSMAAAEVVKTEAASAHFLAANWRPITMLTFTALIVARWFGWAAPELSDAEYLALWDIVQLGLGGYVVGRSAEKIVPALAGALKGK